MSSSSNTVFKAIGLALVVVGLGLAFWGHQMSGSVVSQVSSRLTGALPDAVMYRYVGGAVCVVVGGFLLLKK